MAEKNTPSTAPYSEFGARLFRLRTDAGLTRAQLGELCDVAPSTIVNYENGTRIPYADTAILMARVFNITTEELIGGNNSELTMMTAEAEDKMRAISGSTGAKRVRSVCKQAVDMAGGDLDDDQLTEFAMEMFKAASIAQQKLCERYTNKRYMKTVEAKAEKTDQIVDTYNSMIKDLVKNK